LRSFIKEKKEEKSRVHLVIEFGFLDYQVVAPSLSHCTSQYLFCNEAAPLVTLLPPIPCESILDKYVTK